MTNSMAVDDVPQWVGESYKCSAYSSTQLVAVMSKHVVARQLETLHVYTQPLGKDPLCDGPDLPHVSHVFFRKVTYMLHPSV